MDVQEIIHTIIFNKDSGGPLVDMKTKKQVGIVSFGANGKCADGTYPGKN